MLEELEVTGVTLVGFSMGGGEVARYFSNYDGNRVHSVVFAAAVPPYLRHTDDNPDGPLTDEMAGQFESGLKDDASSFYDTFVEGFLSNGERVVVTDEQRAETRAECDEADHRAALECMQSWASTDFRNDLPEINVPTLIIHGDSDQTVPYEGSGKRTHEAIEGSTVHLIAGGPHGCNLSHADEFNRALVDFLAV